MKEPNVRVIQEYDANGELICEMRVRLDRPDSKLEWLGWGALYRNVIDSIPSFNEYEIENAVEEMDDFEVLFHGEKRHFKVSFDNE